MQRGFRLLTEVKWRRPENDQQIDSVGADDSLVEIESSP